MPIPLFQVICPSLARFISRNVMNSLDGGSNPRDLKQGGLGGYGQVYVVYPEVEAYIRRR